MTHKSNFSSYTSKYECKECAHQEIGLRKGVPMGRERTFYFIFFLSVLLTACGQKQSTPVSGVKSSSVIIGDLNWNEVTIFGNNEAYRRNSRFVADVRIPKVSSRCTGFLISEDYLMTNQHCVTSSSNAQGITAIFNHEAGVPRSQWEIYQCDQFITNDIVYDFAILKCSGSPGKKYGYAKLSQTEVNFNDSLYVIQQNCNHQEDPGCDFTKKISFGNVIDLDLEIVHNADTLGGSSGSPVFNKDDELIGLHHGGAIDRNTGEGVANFAVPTSEIYDYLEAHFPDVLPFSFEGVWLDLGDNNRIKKSTQIDFNQSELIFGGSIDSRRDKDFYKFHLKKDGKINIKVEFKHLYGDLDIKLYNSKKRKVAKSCSTTDNEQITANLKAGTYYLRIKGHRKAENRYTVNIVSL